MHALELLVAMMLAQSPRERRSEIETALGEMIAGADAVERTIVERAMVLVRSPEAMRTASN